ncbi:MAG: hypothetical protein Q4A64_02890 [Porphyromonadaceae bacterium]|nr:hypothetical protein [Porphyromonadaceae bacterium]
MKLKKYFAYAAVLLGVFASSCTQMDDLLTTESNIVEGATTPRITATLTLGEFRALEFDVDGEELNLTSNSDNFDTHAYFYNSTKKLLGYARLKWIAQPQGNGVYNLTLRNPDDLKVEIIDGGNGYRQVRPRDGWYITGLAGGGILSSDKKSISFPDNIDQPRGRILAPLSFPWSKYDNDEISVHFKPLGVIIRPIVINNTNEPLKAISQIESDGLSNKGTFDISASIAESSFNSRQHLPWTFEWEKQGKPAPALSRTPFSVSQGAQTSQTYLTWGMVYTEPTQNYKVRISESTDRYYLKKSTGVTFNEHLSLKNGVHYIFDLLLKIEKPITPPVTPPDVSINQNDNLVGCWMQGNLKATGVLGVYPGLFRPRLRPGIWMDEGNPRSIHHDDNSYFSWTGINTLLANSQVVLEKFRNTYLPSAYEFAQLFPNPTNNVKCINFGAGAGHREISVNERVALGGYYGSYQEYKATYKSTASRVVYALRHVGHDNKYRSAFRYELQKDLSGAGLVIKVQVYHLGAKGDVTMAQISDEAWWRRHQDARVIYFSTPGYANLSGSRYIGGSPEIADGNFYGLEDPHNIRNRYRRGGLLRHRRLPRPGYQQPTILECGRSGYYWSSTANGAYGLKFTSGGSGYHRSDESVFIQVGRIDNSQPYYGYTVRLKRSCR